MMVVAIVGVVFAALAVCGMWLNTQDPAALRDMGVQLDREPLDRDLITEPQPDMTRRPAHTASVCYDPAHPADHVQLAQPAPAYTVVYTTTAADASCT